MGHQPARDYGQSTKLGVGAGAALFAFGVIGQLVAPRLQASVPEWELSLFVWLSVGGILIALLSVFVFGVAMPLVE